MRDFDIGLYPYPTALVGATHSPSADEGEATDELPFGPEPPGPQTRAVGAAGAAASGHAAFWTAQVETASAAAAGGAVDGLPGPATRAVGRAEAHSVGWPTDGNTSWSPSDISGLRAWWDVNDSATLRQNSDGSGAVTSDGDPVGWLADRSGNGYTLTQGTAANRPSYRVDISNGRPMLHFDGTNDHLSRSNVPLMRNVSGATLVVVSIPDNPAPTGNQLVVWISIGTSSSLARATFIYNNGNTRTGGRRTDGDSGQGFNIDATSAGSLELIEVSFDYANARIYGYSYGQSKLDSAFQSAGSTSNTDASLVRLGNSAGSEWFAGYIGEIIVYDKVLDANERTDLFTYLTHKWMPPPGDYGYPDTATAYAYGHNPTAQATRTIAIETAAASATAYDAASGARSVAAASASAQGQAVDWATQISRPCDLAGASAQGQAVDWNAAIVRAVGSASAQAAGHDPDVTASIARAVGSASAQATGYPASAQTGDVRAVGSASASASGQPAAGIPGSTTRSVASASAQTVGSDVDVAAGTTGYPQTAAASAGGHAADCSPGGTARAVGSASASASALAATAAATVVRLVISASATASAEAPTTNQYLNVLTAVTIAAGHSASATSGAAQVDVERALALASAYQATFAEPIALMARTNVEAVYRASARDELIERVNRVVNEVVYEAVPKADAP